MNPTVVEDKEPNQRFWMRQNIGIFGGRALPIAAAVIVLLTIGAVMLSRRHTTSPRVSATSFRAYLARPESRMVAYSPDAAVAADPELLRRQLALLREKFDGLSLYDCTAETVKVVETARSLGYKAALLTVWDPRSESELATAGSLVRDQADAMAMAISIGSEGLMERRYTLADMRAAHEELLEREAGLTSVEITTTEPWWLYMQAGGDLPAHSEEVRTFGDFASVNVHVVWDTGIVDPVLAASWTRDRANEVRSKIGRPVLVREAGFPGGGSSPREGLRTPFTREMQASFWSAWLKLGNRPPIAVFEGVDNPGKHWRDFEGSWGLVSASMHPWPAWEVFPALPAAKAGE
jgi:hypothetical protein